MLDEKNSRIFSNNVLYFKKVDDQSLERCFLFVFCLLPDMHILSTASLLALAKEQYVANLVLLEI